MIIQRLLAVIVYALHNIGVDKVSVSLLLRTVSFIEHVPPKILNVLYFSYFSNCSHIIYTLMYILSNKII